MAKSHFFDLGMILRVIEAPFVLTRLLANRFYFRYCFPFGRPEGSLKATVSLLERVSCLESSWDSNALILSFLSALAALCHI